MKVEEPLKEEEVPVRKRIAHEGARKYPPQVAAPVKHHVNPMHVSYLTDYSENLEKNALFFKIHDFLVRYPKLISCVWEPCQMLSNVRVVVVFWKRCEV